MDLELGSGKVIKKPDASAILDALFTLDDDSNNYAVLSRDQLTYMQACGSRAGGYVVEYQEGSLEEHYRTTGDDVPISKVVEVFQKYAAGDESWRQIFAWQKMKVEPSSSWRGGLVLLALVVVIVAAIYALRMSGWWSRIAAS